MCGASRHSCNPFRNDYLPYFLRHRQARRRNPSVKQNGKRRATLALCAILITTKRNRRWMLKMNTTNLPSYYQNVALPFSLVRGLSIVIKGICRLYTRRFWSVRIDKQERIGEFRHFKAILSVFACPDDKVIIRKILTAQRAFFTFRQNVFSCLVVWLRNKISINKNI